MGQMISYSIVTTSMDTSATSVSIAPPPEYAVGNLLVMVVTGGSTSGTAVSASTPSGWTAVSSSGNGLSVFYKTATSSEPSSYTVTMSATACIAAYIAAYPAATVSGHSFGNSGTAIASYSSSWPSGVTSSQIVLVAAAAVAGLTSGIVVRNAGYQNVVYPSGLTPEVPVFGPAQPNQTGTYVYPCAVGLYDVTGSTMSGLPAPVFTSPQLCSIHVGYVVISVTGVPPVVTTVTAVSNAPTGSPGLVMTVKALSGAASPAQILAGGATTSYYASGTSSAPQLSITPNASGSWVYGAVTENFNVSTSTAYTPNSSTVFSQNSVDAGHSNVYGVFRSVNTTTASTPVTLGGTAPANNYFTIALAEILAASGQTLSEVASAVVNATAPGNFSTTSVSQTAVFATPPPTGSLFIAVISTNSIFGNGNASITMSDSIGLTWVKLVERTYPSYSGVWMGYLPATNITSTGSAFLGTMSATGFSGSVTSSGTASLGAMTATGGNSAGIILDEAGNAVLDEAGSDVLDETGSGGGGSGVTHVQDQHAVNGPGTSFTVNIASTAGNCLVAYVTAHISGNNPVHLLSVTDNAGNTWTYSTASQAQNPPASGSYDSTAGEYGFTAIAVCVNAVAVSTVTLVLSAAAVYAETGVSEFSGVVSGSGITASAASSALVTSASYSTPSLSVPTGAEIVIAVTSAASAWSSTGTGWVLLSYADALGAYTVNVAGGTATGQFTAVGAVNVPSSAILAIGPNPGTGSVILDEGGNPVLDEAGNNVLDESGGAGPPTGLTLVATYPGGSNTDGVGPQSTAIGNTAGNLLVLTAAWNTTSTSTGSSQLPPAGTVCDSAGNWWVLAADSGEGCLGVRTAVWYCANALTIGTGLGDWVSLGLTGYVANLVWMISEFSGLPDGYTPAIDFAVGNSSNGGVVAAISTSAVTGAADFCFAVGAAGSATAVASSAPGSPWSTIAYQASALNSDGVSAYYSYASAAAGTSLSPVWPFSGEAYGSALVIGITQASLPPSNGNPNFPYVRTQLALGANSGDPSYAVTEGQWVDVTQRTLANGVTASITASRGRQYELSQPEAGTLTIAMNNLDGAFNPSSPGSPYYSNAVNSNMSFQSGVTPWTPVNGAALSVSSAFTFASSEQAVSQQSLVVTPGGSATPGAYSGEFTVTSPNSVFTFSCWVYCQSAWTAGVFCAVNEFNASFTQIGSIAGTPVSIPAGTWTQVALTGAVVTNATAAYVQPVITISGNPPTSAQFYIAEAALVYGGNIVQTGLVRIATPVRVSAYWDGRWYAVGYGLTERWPQDWPDLPQWGFSSMVAADTVNTASSITLSSAVQGEILADAPYACFPFDDNYSTTSTTVNGPTSAASNAAGLIAINTSRVNQRTALYVTETAAVETGQTMSFLGDSGTGMGTTAFTDAYTGTNWGPGAVYGPDVNLPPIGYTTGSSYEFWFTFPSGMTKPASSLLFQYLQVFCQPAISTVGPALTSPGWLLTAGMRNPAAAGSTQAFVQQSTSTAEQSMQVLSDLAPGVLHHMVIAIGDSGSTIAYLDGVATALTVQTGLGNVIAVGFGQSHYSYGNRFALWNYSLAYGTIYNYFLPAARVKQHYISGSAGFIGDSFTKRAGRYVAWSGTGVPLGGPGNITDNASLSAAYSTAGNTLADALNNDATSTGGIWYAPGSGNLVILPRPALYGLNSTVTFGDNTLAGEIPYTPNVGFDYDNTYLSNVTQATLSQGSNTSVAPVDKDLNSINTYGQRGPSAITVSAQYNQTAFDAAAWRLAKYKQPQVRVRQITVDAASYPAAFNAVLQTEIADVATVIRRPVGAPPYELSVITEKVDHQIGPGYWKTTYQLSPYVQEASALIADITNSDVLGTATLAW